MSINTIEDTEDFTFYRWDPIYTLSHVGLEPCFRPTGGHLVFRMTPDQDNLQRKVMRDYKDVMTIEEVRSALLNKPSEASDIYRPNFIQDGEPNPAFIALNLFPFGVTSISKISHKWTSNYRATAQPLLIYGAPSCNKATYTDYDALRIPSKLVTVATDTDHDNIRAYLHLTFKKVPGNNWDLHFVFSPYPEYKNMEMMARVGYSLTNTIGIVDYINRGRMHTDIFQSKGTFETEPHWYFEGFVFNPNNRWYVHNDEMTLNLLMDAEHSVLLLFQRNKPAMFKHFKLGEQLQNDEDEDYFDVQKRHDEDDDENSHLKKLMEMPTGALRGYMPPPPDFPRRFYNPRATTPRKQVKKIVKIPRKSTSYGRRRSPPPKKKTRSGRAGPFYPIAAATGFKPQSPPQSPPPNKGPPVPIPKFAPITQNRNFIDLPNNNKVAVFSIVENRKAVRDISSGAGRLASNGVCPPSYNFSDALSKHVDGFFQKNQRTLLPLLPADSSHTLKTEMIFSLLAAAFLNRLDIQPHVSGYESAIANARGQMNMGKLFSSVRIAKLRCLINYFYHGLTNPALISNRTITFVHGQTATGPLANLIDDDRVVRPPVAIDLTRNIEDVPGAVWADFANKRFGGGVFGRGQVQEEIQLCLYPEALLGRLLFPTLTDHSSFRIMGPAQFADFTGYSSTFTFVPYKPAPVTAKDVMGRALTEITAFDAVDFSKGRAATQYNPLMITREYYKAQSAFVVYPNTEPLVPVVTGPWGAGAFGGDQALKIILQWLAACAADREIIFTRVQKALIPKVDTYIRIAVKANLSAKSILRSIIRTFNNRKNNYQYSIDIMIRGLENDLKNGKAVPVPSLPGPSGQPSVPPLPSSGQPSSSGPSSVAGQPQSSGPSSVAGQPQSSGPPPPVAGQPPSSGPPPPVAGQLPSSGPPSVAGQPPSSGPPVAPRSDSLRP